MAAGALAVPALLLAVLPCVTPKPDPPLSLDQQRLFADVSVEVGAAALLTVGVRCRGNNSTGGISALALIDGRHVLRQPGACAEVGEGTLVFPAVGCGVHSVVVYLQQGNRTEAVSCTEVELPCSPHSEARPEAEPLQLTRATAGKPVHQVGVYYSTYNGLLRGNGSVVSVEDVLRNRSRTLADAAPNYWQHTPKIGPYCLYRKRPAEAKGIVPDCPDIDKTLESHASTLLAAGIDYIMLDATNWGPWNNSTRDIADVTQLRPTEVIFEEWHQLRSAGKRTPQITVWNRIDAGSSLYNVSADTLWQQYLSRIYNNASYNDLILRAPDGRKVFFVVWFPWAINQTAVEAIESNGRRNDIVVVHK